MSGDSGFSAKIRIALMVGLFCLLSVAGDQPWIASSQAKEPAKSKPGLVAYFVSWHKTEHGSSSRSNYSGIVHSDATHSMKMEMTGSAIMRYRAGTYFDIRFLTVTRRLNDTTWIHTVTTFPNETDDCMITNQYSIIDPGAYSGFHADAATSGVTWELLGTWGLREPDRQPHKQLEDSFARLANMRFTVRYTHEEGGTCNHPGARDSLSFPPTDEPGTPHGKHILEADSSDRTSFSVNQQFTYIQPSSYNKGGSDEKRYVTWTAHAYRMGKCAAHDAPIKAGDPIIDHEQVDIQPDRTEVDPNPFPGADSNIANLKIRVTCEGVPVEKEDVDISVEVLDQSGGHVHSDENRPRGTIDGKVVTKDSVPRTTNGNGEVKLKYGSPLTGDIDHAGYGDYQIGIAGVYKVTAKSKKFPEATKTVAITAKVDGLIDLPANPNLYVAEGATDSHPTGFHGTPITLSEFANLANDFQKAQEDHNQDLQLCHPPPSPWLPLTPMSLNDIALADGGIFDWMHLNWHPSHQTHNKGEGGDFNRFNAVTGTATDCINGTTVPTVPKRAWLLHTLMWKGQAYGKWDCSDLGNPPGCTDGEPPNSVAYITSHPGYLPVSSSNHTLHLHVQDANP